MAKNNGDTTTNVRVVDREIVDPIAEVRYNRLLKSVQQVLNRTQTAGGRAENSTTRWSRDPSSGRSLDRRTNLYDECGYPETEDVGLSSYRDLYLRNPVAKKIVDILPNHCWQVHPQISESEDLEEETAFELAVKDLGKHLRGESWYQDDEGNPVWEYLSRVDRVAGIGHYGCLLLGVGGPEGKNLSQPLLPRESNGKGKSTRELIYLKAFPQYLAPIESYDDNSSSPRFGLPDFYSMIFDDTDAVEVSVETSSRPVMEQQRVHWSRVIHVTHEMISNEVLHIPSMLPVLNRLLDLDRLYGGSTEMMWKGGFPGYSIETHPQLGGDVEVDMAGMRTELEKHMSSLQRWLVTTGMTVNPLTMQVADPTAHINVQLEAICLSKDCPKRVFLGSERGELASSQDKAHWNSVIQARRERHLTPRLIVPFVDRTIWLGILPQPEGYSAKWPEIETVTPAEKADMAVKITQAIVAYIQGDGVQLMPVMQFLTIVLGLTLEEANEIMDALEADDLADMLIEKAIAPPEPVIMPGAGKPPAPGKPASGGKPFPPGAKK